jgi:NadR type nicotinamide-nucleotide adenylyltransferase
MPKPNRIAITGPESTGKSMLTQLLAEHYRTVWVPEYAREYIDRLGRQYEQEDILEIARGQLRSEREKEKGARGYLFCDTELIVTKIWSQVKYDSVDGWILRQIGQHRYDLYLLCYIDIPWEQDPQREHPHMREKLFDLYLQELTERDLPFRVISGLGESRLKNAVEVIEEYFSRH